MTLIHFPESTSQILSELSVDPEIICFPLGEMEQQRTFTQLSKKSEDKKLTHT